MAKPNPFAGKKAAPFGGGPSKGKPPAFLKKSAAAPAPDDSGMAFRKGGKAKRK